MGQESSSIVDDSVKPYTLKDRSVDSLARFLKSGVVKKIVVMTGAGISTSAGIPDFRSPDTGLYANLARLNLPYAEAVFDISFFRHNPVPFYALAHELYPGKFRPTIAHTFIRLLSDKGLLLKLFTQNIDCLEREAGVPDHKIIEAHGSFARQRCIECKTPYPDDLMKDAVKKNEVPLCLTPQCNGIVKPDIVFFGEQLPLEFRQNETLPAEADLCIIMGTSLSVQPFASLPSFCADGVPRLLINRERVGGIGSRPDDILLLGDCDDGVRTLAKALGWLEELEKLWAQTTGKMYKEDVELRDLAKDGVLEAEVAKITEEVDKSLKASNDHGDWLREQLLKEKQDDDWTSSEGSESTEDLGGEKPNGSDTKADPHQQQMLDKAMKSLERLNLEAMKQESPDPDLEAILENQMSNLDHIFPKPSL
ncbi:MAG: Sir2 histone deacetylase Hst2 [Icmadophila ericetorum]|nr:Sir2 histone deacetylase Hst2 [Icmadophila ericetorum]